MDNREQFSLLLKQFGASLGEQLELNDDSCAFVVDGEIVVNFQYLPESDMVVLWSTVGDLPEDEYCAERARYLLEKQDFWQESGGFTLGLDLDERRVVCHDVQEAGLFTSLDLIAAWVDTLVEVTTLIRKEIAELYPSQDDFDDFE